MQCFSWETSEKFERIKIRKFIIKKFVCSINRNMFDGASVKDQKSKHFYNRKIRSFAENWRRKKYEEKCLRGIWCKDEYDFHMDCKQKKIFEAHESVQTTSIQWSPRWAVFTWFKNAHANNIPVNRIIIKEKALSLAKIHINRLNRVNRFSSLWWAAR